MTLGIGGGGSAIVAALFAVVNPAALPILAFGALAGGDTVVRSALLGRRLTDEMSILKQIGDEIFSIIEESG